MNKLGMGLERDIVDPTCGLPARVHAITKARYLSASQGGDHPHGRAS